MAFWLELRPIWQRRISRKAAVRTLPDKMPGSEYSKAGKESVIRMARASWLKADSMQHVLAAMMPQNRLAIQVAMETGLRIGDVLALRTEVVQRGQRFTIKEQKTGKSRRVRLSRPLWDKCLANAGRYWVFEGRTDVRKHRTRAAVYKDIHRTAKLFKASGVVPKKANVGTHTARKVWAVEQYRKCPDIAKLQRSMNHSSPAITMVYAMADSLAVSQSGPPYRQRRRRAKTAAAKTRGQRGAPEQQHRPARAERQKQPRRQAK